MFKKGLSYNLLQILSALSADGYAFIFLILLICVPATKAQTKYLEPNVPFSREISPNQKQLYRIKVGAGNFFRISVQQQPGVDLIITLHDTGKRRKLAAVGGYKGFLKMDGGFSLESWFEVVSLPFIASSGGVYEIELNARDTQISGRYEIKIHDVHPTTAADRKRVEAEKIFESGEQLRFWSRGKEDLQFALKRYEEALKIYRDINDKIGEALTLDAIGMTYWGIDVSNNAIEFFEAALRLCQSAGDQRKAAVLLMRISQTRREKNNYDDATVEFRKSVVEVEQSLQIWRALGDKRGEARALNLYAHTIGRLSFDADNLMKVKNIFRQSLDIFRELDSPCEEALVLYGMAVYFSFISEAEESLKYYQQGLALLKPLGYKRYIVYGLLRVGENFYEHGDYQNAFDYYSEALEYSRNTNSNYEAYTLYNLANSSLTFDKKKVFEYLNHALPIWEENRNGEAYTLVSIGRYYFSENQNQEALEFYTRALPLMRGTGDMYGVGIILTNLGETYFALNDTAKAIEYYNQALELHRKAKNRRDEARTLIRLGDVYKTSVEMEKAFSDYTDALKLYRAIGNRSGEASALYSLAKAESDRGNLAAARSLIEENLRIVEALRAGIAGEELRSAYFSSVQQYYEFYIDLLMTLHSKQPNKGFDRLALETAERGRARILLELLAASQVDLRQGVDKILLAKENDLQKKLDAKSAERLQMLTEPHTEKQAVAIEKEIEDLANDLQATKARINVASPRLAELTQASTLSAREMQNLLDDNTVLLEYNLGEQRSFLWLVTTDDIKSFVLPKRAELEKGARRVYELLTARNKKIKGETDKQAQSRFEKADEEFQKAALDLSCLIIAPVAPLLGDKRLAIVGDWALQYIPFAALKFPSSKPQVPDTKSEAPEDQRPKTEDRYLIETNEIVNLPSASTLAALRRESVKRPSAPQSLAVLADPVFSKKDERVRESMNQKPSASNKDAPAPEIKFSTERALFDFGLGERTGIPRLPFSRREAEIIVSMAPAQSWFKALDFEANRATATSTNLSKYRIVHFATHGLLNSSHPELSGLLFSLVDKRGEPQNGFLPLQEIYNLKFNADLVVLSACQTGLGKEIRGEGLVGLTRGFMYAGSKRVAASLWKVDDAATAELMQHFYKGILQDKQSPAAALRSAQIQMRKQRNWRQPYFWAAFVIQGEWR